MGLLGTNACNHTPHIEVIKKKCKNVIGNICKIANKLTPPKLKIEIFNVYAMPHFRYGLANLLYQNQNIVKMNTELTKGLKGILGLPKNTSNCKVMYMAGHIPIRDLAQITFLGSYRGLLKYYDQNRIPRATRGLGNAILESYGYTENELRDLNFREIKEYIKARAICKMMDDVQYNPQMPLVRFPKKLLFKTNKEGQ